MVEIFKALAEENRLRILSLLLQNDLCVCEIEYCLELKQSNISRHLSALKSSGLLDSYKQAQWVYYKISDKFKEEHQNLWFYLIQNLKELPNYQMDFEKCKNCKRQCLCSNKDSKID